MRLRKTFKNITSSLLLEIVSILSGLILPRFILIHFGSSYNGLLSSIAHFVSCGALLKSGINSVTRVALYKPLFDKSDLEINKVVNASRYFYRVIAYIYLAILVVLAVVYPVLIGNEFDWLFTFFLFMIIGASSFFQYYFGATYHTLLQADQKEYVYTFTQVITVFLNLIISIFLLEINAGIHIVKLGSTMVYILNPLFLNWYAHRHYSLDKSIPADLSLIHQRWDAFGHQIATFIHTNTDVLVLSVFASTTTVSIYNVYYLAVIVIRKIIMVSSAGIEALFGNILVSENKEYLKKYFSCFEFLIYGMSVVFYSATLLLIIPFALLYTSGVNDTNYSHPLFALLLIAGEFFNCIRMPYQIISNADGHFKETKWWAYLEAIVNVVISIITVRIWGLVGVAIGTLVAMIIRTGYYAYFVSQNVIYRNVSTVWGNMIFSILMIGLNIVAGVTTARIVNVQIDNWLVWIIMGCIYTLESTLILLMALYIFKHRDFLSVISVVKVLVKNISKKKR